MKYPNYAKALIDILQQDQDMWQKFWRDNYKRQGTAVFQDEFENIWQRQRAHALKVLGMMDVIGKPTISNIGQEAAQALSIIALHDSLGVLRRVYDAFVTCHEHNPTDTYYQAIPSMIDRIKILERQPQLFGTQWEVDDNHRIGRFLPTVEDFAHVNDRRAVYGIGPLRWPRSLAIPEAEQLWLRRPLSELVMRDITDIEFADRYQRYLED